MLQCMLSAICLRRPDVCANCAAQSVIYDGVLLRCRSSSTNGLLGMSRMPLSGKTLSMQWTVWCSSFACRYEIPATVDSRTTSPAWPAASQSLHGFSCVRSAFVVAIRSLISGVIGASRAGAFSSTEMRLIAIAKIVCAHGCKPTAAIVAAQRQARLPACHISVRDILCLPEACPISCPGG